tara:strand:- start:18 stop:1007 length:990 start_codon:yes stop_codon:yes gene_type:complete
MKKNISQNINYFGFIAILLAGIILTLKLPDVDRGLMSLIGHRSIITHSILFPYLMHYFLINKKDRPNSYLVIFIIGFYLSIAIHLSADIYPKGWRGTALIKLPGNNSIGEGPSIIWMGLNMIVATYFSAILLKKIANTKKYWITYLIIGSVVGLMYAAADEGEVGAKFLTFLFFLFVTFFYSLGKSKTGTSINTKGLKKFAKIVIWLILAGVVIIFIIIGIEHSAEKDKQRKIQQEKETNYRAYQVFKDEFNLCKNNIIAKYPKKKFVKFNYSDYWAPKNKKTYTKTLKMWMKHDGLIFKNKFFGKVDCFINVKSDQSISFNRLGDKYK